MARKLTVTFITHPARILPETHGAGSGMEFGMVTGVLIGDYAPLQFTPPDYNKWAISGAMPGRQSYNFPSYMALRLGRFVQTRFVAESDQPRNYDSTTLVNVLMRYSTQFVDRPRRRYEFARHPISGIEPGKPYAITEDGAFRYAMIGLGPGLALTVTGRNSALAICPVEPLVRAYDSNAQFMLITGVST